MIPAEELDARLAATRRRVAEQQERARDLRRRRREVSASAQEVLTGTRTAPRRTGLAVTEPALGQLHAELDRARDHLHAAYEQSRAVGYRPGPEAQRLAAAELAHQQARTAYQQALGR